MPILDLTIEQVIELVKQLPPEGKKAVLNALRDESPNRENSWLKIAGKYENDSQFDEMLEYIETDRQLLDIEMDNY